MSNGQHPVDLLPELALGVLPRAESERVEAHLRECETCTAEFDEMAAVSKLLPYAVEEFGPAPGLMDGVFARIRDERPTATVPAEEAQPMPANVISFRQRLPRWRWVGAVAASAAALLVAGAALGFALGDEQPDAAAPLQAAAVRAAADGTLRVARSESNGMRASVVQAPRSRSAYIQVSGLPAAPEGKAYQAWFSEDGKTFEPSDVFPDGEGAWVPAEGEVAGYAVMGVTLEDEDGATSPTLPGVIFIDLTKSTAMRWR
ncbi:MAG: anti-sigma factor domain-containing protein [Dehalococcoidia bacterium]